MHAFLSKLAGMVLTESAVRWLVRRSFKYLISYAEAYAKKTETEADDNAVLVLKDVFEGWEIRHAGDGDK